MASDLSIISKLMDEIAQMHKHLDSSRYPAMTGKQITERLLKEIYLMQTYFDFVGGIVVVIDKEKNVLILNKKGSDILDCPHHECIGKNWFHDFLPKETRDEALDMFDNILKGKLKIIESYEAPLVTKKGDERIIAWHTTVLYDDYGKVTGVLNSGIDVTERKKTEKAMANLNKELEKTNRKLKRLALKDIDTGLYNHRYFEDIIQKEFFRVKNSNNPLSVILIDVDYFKSINDVYGHHFGDLILKQFAKKLRKLVRLHDYVIRFGGEEFVVVSPNSTREDAMNMARGIFNALKISKFGDGGISIKLRLSASVVSYPDDSIYRSEDFIDLVEKVIEKVKEHGGGRIYSSLDIIKPNQIYTGKEDIDVEDIEHLKDKFIKVNKKINQSLIESIFAFSKTIELKDHDTGDHVERTVYYTSRIAKEIGLDRSKITLLEQGSRLHDLGKIGISEKILLKKGKLTSKEFEKIKEHPKIGVDIIRPIKLLHDLIPLILYHHERWDGKGYPFGLKGKEIPIGARIISVADVYQALISDRPYRRALSKKNALKIIKKSKGLQFDPAVVDAFMNIISREN